MLNATDKQDSYPQGVPMFKTGKPVITTCDCVLGEGPSVPETSCQVMISDVRNVSLICKGDWDSRVKLLNQVTGLMSDRSGI